MLSIPLVTQNPIVNVTTLGEIARECDAGLRGPNNTVIQSIAPLRYARDGQVCLVDHPRWLAAAHHSGASALIVPPSLAEHQNLVGRSLLIHADPGRVILTVLGMLQKSENKTGDRSIHPTAVIHPSAKLGNGCSIGALSIIGPQAHISEKVQVGSLCSVEDGATIGSGSKLENNVIIHRDCHIGSDCLVQSGSVIGTGGFYFTRLKYEWSRFPSSGSVIISDNVEIGANTTIARGIIDNTIIGCGAKLDNLIQIAHDVHIGERCIIAACTGIAGGTEVGAETKISGRVSIGGNLFISTGVHIAGGTIISQSITKPGHYAGYTPFMISSLWRRNFSVIKQLYLLKRRIVNLERNRNDLKQ